MNIKDNYLPDQVEFILLDYGSSDGLYEWCMGLQDYIRSGILIYYRVPNQTVYHRSHSRNMAMQLANGEIICNLDADNYLGRNFAKHVIRLFDKQKDIFATTNLLVRDVFGRICFRKQDFMQVRGYNEHLASYGVEDIDLFYRLSQQGLKHKILKNPTFHRFIPHSHKERVINEAIYHDVKNIYVNYVNYYLTNVFITLNDQSYLKFHLINNIIRYSNLDWKDTPLIHIFYHPKNRIIISEEIETGHWRYENNAIYLIEKNKTCPILKDGIRISGKRFYELVGEPKNYLISTYSDTTNYNAALASLKSDHAVNPSGFGMGEVYENFSATKIII